MKPWVGTQRELIGDNWFGSVRTALALLKYDIYSVLSIKNGHKGFPKDDILQRLNARGETAHFAASINGK